jgi:hypothetical protein
MSFLFGKVNIKNKYIKYIHFSKNLELNHFLFQNNNIYNK